MDYLRLDEICEINMGQSPSSNSYNEEGEGIPFFQGNADFGEMYPTVRIWCNKPTKVVNKGTLLISVRAPIGALNFAKESSCIGRGLAGITVKNGFELKYIYYNLKYRNEELNNKGTGSTFKAISKSSLGEVLIKNIPIEKQKEYVKKLDLVHKIIAEKKEQIKKFDTLIKSRFLEMFGDPVINPYDFEKVTINDVCSSIVRGPFGSALKKAFFVEPNNTTYKVYEQKNAIQKCAKIGTYYITAEKYEELKRFECFAGDIIMSCSGTMGELYQLPEDCERGIINQALCKFTLNKRILPVVFLVYMKQIVGKLETKGTGIKNIAAVSYVKNMTINLPSMKIQNQFAAFVEQVNKSELEVKASLEKLGTLKKSLMQQYFG